MTEHIQIGDISPRVQYTGDGVQTVFTYPFPIFTNADIDVYEDTTIKTITTHFTVAGAGNSSGGTVSFVSPPASGVVVTLLRNIAIERTSDFQESGEFRAKVINDELDKLTATQQQIETDQDRSLHLGPSDNTSSMVIPDKAARSSKVLAFDANGDPVVSTKDLSDLESEADNAASSAAAALVSENAAAADAVLTAADVVSTAANVTAAQAAQAAIEAAAAGIFWKEPVLNATTANITLSGEQTIDGVLTSASRILVKDQSAPAQNGIYVTAAGAWSRAAPLDAWAEHVGAALIVSQGTANADTSWICTVDAGGTLGTTAISWATFGGGDVKAANNGSEFTEATFKANLNMEAGVDYQAYDADTTKNDVANTFTQVQKFAAGSAAAPSMTFGADTDTGIYNSSADTLAISTAGNERLKLTTGGHTYTSDSHTWKNSGGTQRLAINGAGKLYHGVTDYGAHVSIGHTSNTIEALHVEGGTATSMRGVFFNETNTSYASEVQRISVNKTGATSFNFISTYSANGGDREHVFYGDGTSNADGSWASTGADYAEYFEWLDGNPNNERRHGMSVTLDGGMIRECLVGEVPIGVASVHPTIIGDDDIQRWKQKYLMDDYGDFILGDTEKVMWKTGAPVKSTDAAGNTVIEQSKEGQKVHCYPLSIAPTIPASATDITYFTEQNVKQLNPLWNKDTPYIERKDRPEWSAIGLMGKLRVTKGQVIGANWIKLRDISPSVEEWLVR